MRKMIIISLLMLLAGLGGNSYATLSNLLSDPSFEGLIGTEPNTNSTPWFTVDEGGPSSVVTSTDTAHSGTQSVLFDWNSDAVAIVQDSTLQIISGGVYQVEFWMNTGAASTNAAHTNANKMSVSVYTSSTPGDTNYTFEAGSFGLVNSTSNLWEKFSATFVHGSGNFTNSSAGDYLQVRIVKPTQNTINKIRIDDVSLNDLNVISSDVLIAWDSVTNAAAPAAYDYVASGVTGRLWAGNIYAIDTGGNSTDGTFGNSSGGAEPTTKTMYSVRMGGDKNALGLKITNLTGSDLKLDSIAFDYSRWFANSPKDVYLYYSFGDLAVANTSLVNFVTDVADNIGVGKIDDYYDFDWSLSSLADTVLAPNESATFSLSVSNAVTTSAGGGFDNIAILGGIFLSGYDSWSNDFGLVEGRTGDDDQDGLSNVYEYGLGGDPTNELDQGTSPVFSVDGGGSPAFSYIHPQLSDPASDISYYLELTTDLVIIPWANAGYTVSGTNVTGDDLDFVTNTTDTVDDAKFIRLIIE